MLPFLQIQIDLPGDNENPDKEVIARIQPDSVETFYPGFHYGTIIVMRSGQIYITKMETEKFGAALGNYWAQLNKRAETKNKLLLT